MIQSLFFFNGWMGRIALLLGCCMGLNSWPLKAQSNFHSWAPTPPMGWNSWDCFGPTVTEEEVKANADYMAAHLKQYGWKYVVVDIRWYVGNDKAHGYNETDPAYTLDSFGRYQPAVNRFPSSKNGTGFAPLAKYLHQKGLLFGIHIMRGIPVKAVQQNTRIEGTSYRAKEVYSAAMQCTWLHDNYTVDAAKPGAQEYYNSLFKMYARWGLDFVKIDDLTAPYHKAEVELIRKAIDACGRKIVLSTSPGETPITEAAHVQQNSNMWRTVGDFWDSWLQLKEHFVVFERWNKWRAPGAYPDGDMLPLGHIGIRAERGDPRFTNFTQNEQKTLMALWSMFRSPMMFGGHFPDTDSFTLSLLTNSHLLSILNKSIGNRPLFTTDSTAAWMAIDPATQDRYLAVFNTADQQMAVPEKAIWTSEQISKQTKHYQQKFEVVLGSAEKLYLVVTDGGDNIDWDHANWINPLLIRDQDTIALNSLSWINASAGWQQPLLNKSVSGNTLQTDGITYANGIGTHSNSVIEYSLPEGVRRISGMVGLDDAAIPQNTGATVRFMLFTQSPAGPVPASEAAIPIHLSDVGLKGKVQVTDCWNNLIIGTVAQQFVPIIPKHGCGLYRLKMIP